MYQLADVDAGGLRGFLDEFCKLLEVLVEVHGALDGIEELLFALLVLSCLLSLLLLLQIL